MVQPFETRQHTPMVARYVPDEALYVTKEDMYREGKAEDEGKGE